MNYLVIYLAAGLAVYWVVFVMPGQSGRKDEAVIEKNVARNAQYPQLVAGLPAVGMPYNQNRVCPAGAAQFVAGDYNCNVCHHLAEAVQNFSDATHHYTNIVGKSSPGPYDTRGYGRSNSTTAQSAEPFPDPQLPGYTVMFPTEPAKAPAIIWGATPSHNQRGRCTNCHKILPPAESPQTAQIVGVAPYPHVKRRARRLNNIY